MAPQPSPLTSFPRAGTSSEEMVLARRRRQIAMAKTSGIPPSISSFSFPTTPSSASRTPRSTPFISLACFFFLFFPLLYTSSYASPSGGINSYDNDPSHDGTYSYYYHHDGGSYNEMGEYLSDWNHEWAKMSGRIQQPKCVDIPSNLTLCHDIGYAKMMLPNLLNHDSLMEVSQQATSWVPLTRIDCHPDTKVFLCSLFSPVCLDRLIYPCRSLCLGVQASCAHRMKVHGFDWPDMLKCDKFPLDNDMCIKLIHDVKPDNNCTACKHPLTHESMIDHFCRADVVMKATVKDFKDVLGHKELVLRKKRKLFKFGKLPKKEARSLSVIIEHGTHCVCETINSTQDRYLLMANKKDDKLIINFGILWKRKDKEFRKGLRAIRKSNVCEGIFRELSANGLDSSISTDNNTRSGKKKDRKRKRRKDKKGKKGGKKGKKGKRRKGKRGKKGKKNKNEENMESSLGEGGAAHLSKSELEDRALSNFMKASN